MNATKMLSALAATLCLATTACQMPVEEEDAYVEQEALGHVDPSEVACTSKARGFATPIHDERGLELVYDDECTGEQWTMELGTTEGLIVEGSHPVQGVMVNDANTILSVAGQLTSPESNQGYLLAEVHDGDEVLATVRFDLRHQGAELGFDGKVDWD